MTDSDASWYGADTDNIEKGLTLVGNNTNSTAALCSLGYWAIDTYGTDNTARINVGNGGAEEAWIIVLRGVHPSDPIISSTDLDAQHTATATSSNFIETPTIAYAGWFHNGAAPITTSDMTERDSDATPGSSYMFSKSVVSGTDFNVLWEGLGGGQVKAGWVVALRARAGGDQIVFWS